MLFGRVQVMEDTERLRTPTKGRLRKHGKEMQREVLHRILNRKGH